MKTLPPIRFMRWSTLFIIGAFLCGVIGYADIRDTCDALGAQHLFLKDARASDGYLLVAPLASAVSTKNPGEIHLIDQNGITVHTWHTTTQPVIAHLTNNGTLLISRLGEEVDFKNQPALGTTGVIEELSWDGDVLWEHRDIHMAFDMEPLPDGSIAYMRWEKAPSWFTDRVQGGFGPREETWTQAIVVINRLGIIESEWHMYEHMKPEEYPLDPFVPAQDWAHTNSIRYVAENPITHTPAFLLSFRNSSAIVLVDIASGEVVWRSPADLTALQHDATMLPNGNVLVFDNGLFRKNTPALMSRVIEIDPRTNAIVWNYGGGDSTSGKLFLASSVMGSAERLPNGNTLIGISTTGRIIEVMPDGTVVWEYLNMFNDNSNYGLVFHARKYEAQGTAWGVKVAISGFFAGVFCRQ